MKIMLLGGDGFCGWPTALHMSTKGHEVTIVDNLVRRSIDLELGTSSLTPIRPLHARLEGWHRLTGKTIAYERCDVAEEYDRLLEIVRRVRPDCVVHFAEQKSAPYSMLSSWHKRYTIRANLSATTNILCAITDAQLDAHLVHLGTTGVYGYHMDFGRIPEGYLRVQVPGEDGGIRDKEILYPPRPGSIYHLTKAQDQLLFEFYARNNGLRITDLHQGIVWGTFTELTQSDASLVNRFDYDGDFGTVLNRFIVQAALKYPLTVYGTGEQTRAFIHIRDSIRCIELAALSPPPAGDRVRIMNQCSETHRVIDLAHMVSRLTGVEVQHLQNPRAEDAANALEVRNDALLSLGLTPTTLSTDLVTEVHDIALKHIANADTTRILSRARWRST